MGKHLTEKDRYTLERLLKQNYNVKDIALILNKSVRTIYREIKRGSITLINDNLTEYQAYCADVAQNDFERKAHHKGPKFKFLDDDSLVKKIQKGILVDFRSPDDIIGAEKQLHPGKSYPCTKTIYNYIDRDLIPGISNKNLWVKCNKKIRKKTILKRRFIPSTLRSIEERGLSVLDRLIFGHWEMDCIESQKSDPTTLLVLTERLSRLSLVFVMPDQTQASVKICLDNLERKYRSKFKKIFKSITVDHGKEFINDALIETSIFTKKKRTTIYYCHPYCPSERGSNENWNKQIRRFIKKGVRIANLSLHFIKESVTRINNMHRKILNYRTSQEVFDSYIAMV